MSSPEQHTRAPERSSDHIREAAESRSKELLKQLENKLESKENEQNQVATERKRIEALFSKESGAEKKSHHLDSESPQKPASKKKRQASYKQTLKRVRAEMPPAQRAFSKFIHFPAVEKASDVLGSTIARPNSILAGSFSAFVFVAAIYVLASTMGFRLSGFEMIGAFIIGWFVGVSYDLLRTMVTGKRQ
jgi:hypothetical protein